MNEMSSTIRELLVKAEAAYGDCDAFRYKVKTADAKEKKVSVEKKTYTELKQDSERVSAALYALGENNTHVAILGATSYEWVLSYLGVVNGGNVAVPLDAQLSSEDICDLLTRADVTTLIFDDSKSSIAEDAAKNCPGLKHLIGMNRTEEEENILSFWKLVGEQNPGYAHEPKPEDLATIMFTSGTTGKSISSGTSGNSITPKNTVLTTSNTSNYNNTSLPKTGVEDSMPIVVLAVVLGISAIYAYKKIQDYKNI